MSGQGIIIKVSSDCTLGSSTGDGTSPPGLPDGGGDIDEIAGYSGRKLDFNSNELCDNLDDGAGEEICQTALNSLFYSNAQESNDIIFFKTTKGGNAFKSFIKSHCNDSLWDCDSVNNVIVDGKSYDTQKLIYWYYDDDKYISIKQWGDDMGVLDSSVVKHFLNKYPPIEI